MKKFKTLALAAAISAGLAATSAHSAEQFDGILDPDESSAFFDIYLRFEEVIRIWGLEDVELTGDEGLEGVEAYKHSFCVFTNDASDVNTYKLTVASDNDFELAGVDGATVEYKLKVLDVEGNSEESSSSANGEFNVEFNAGPLRDQPNPSIDCEGAGEENVDLEITLAAAADPASGTYTDRVTMTVEPI